MAAILNVFRVRLGAVLVHVILLLTLAVYSSYGGGCTFPEAWTGSWFHSGLPGLITINSTHILYKGECSETSVSEHSSYDKFLLYDRGEECYRCMVIDEKHESVLQYKESYCSPKDSLSSICESISGDAPLYSMFRKYPRPEPVICPFFSAPFTFSYNRGSGDCANPPSRAESCTDDSRLLLRYMACPDVPGTESYDEELVCLATWKEGSTRYLIGQISSVPRRNAISSDEDTYRCFIYSRQKRNDTKITYNISQSSDASCSGLLSPTHGSRTLKITTSDEEQRCEFPSWIVLDHMWLSLDLSHLYYFTNNNVSLKIYNADGSLKEKQLLACHSILEQESFYIKLVVQVTRGCEKSYVCLVFHRRNHNVLELQQSSRLWSPQDVWPETTQLPYITLINSYLPSDRCTTLGSYTVFDSLAYILRRKRQETTIGKPDLKQLQSATECVAGDYSSASVGCGAAQDSIEFKSSCNSTVYTCYGSWKEGNTSYLIAGPPRIGFTFPWTSCFIYTTHVVNDTVHLSLSMVAHSCDRSVQPGVTGDKAYNLTLNDACMHAN